MSVTSFFKNALKKTLARKGLILVNEKQYKTLLAYPPAVLRNSENTPAVPAVDSIIFSKDRPLQLYAFLESYEQKVREKGNLYILYKASDEKYAKAYTELKNIFHTPSFIFIAEEDFKQQLSDICSASQAKVLAFYVDDMVFTENISYADILQYNLFQYIPCLSRGKDFTYSQVLDKKLVLPGFEEAGHGFFSFRWDYTTEFNDWTYPLGVSAYFYYRSEIIAMLQSIDYKAPNSLETAMQVFKPYFSCRKGLCMEKIACCCIPVNIVQTECYNPVTGYYTAEQLLEKWNEGLKIDISRFYGQGARCIEMNYEFIKR